MSTETPIVCIDTSVFLAFLKAEPGRVSQCAGLFQRAEKGEVQVITSSLTIAEVLYLNGDLLSPEDQAKIDAFFNSSWLGVALVDRLVALEARKVAMQLKSTVNHIIRAVDAIHVATAIRYKAQRLFTYDKRMKEVDIPGLTISEPTGQPTLFP